MKRREFITIAATTVTWPLAVRAQIPQLPVVGFLSSRRAETSKEVKSAFLNGIGKEGFIEGQSVVIKYSWADGDYARLPAYAATMVRTGVALIVAAGAEPSAIAAKRATETIPIVFTSVNDPVGLGLVASLNRPGGNLTGASLFTSQLTSKQLELVGEIVPNMRTIGMLINPINGNADLQKGTVQAATGQLGLRLVLAQASNDAQIKSAFDFIFAQKVDALLVGSDPYFNGRRELLGQLALRLEIPTVYEFRDYTVAGGLMSYGAMLADAYQQAGIYAGKILKGAHPSELPVVQPTRFQLVINIKTAKALGLTVKPSIMAIADEVIE
jgi:putative ABC transport system substrate-binding protein